MTRSRKLISIFLSIVVALFRLSTFTVGAEDIVITGNGSGSSSEVIVQATNETSIQQSNNGNVNNNVDTEANTGGNEVSDNNGSASVSTGNVDSNVEVTNSLNSTQVSSACCPMGNAVNIEIAGNGEGSTNEVDLSLRHDISVRVNQNANIDNRVDGSANTGENRANDNIGNVSIDTGNITVNSRIKNGPVNVYQIDPATSGPNLFASISGNGSDSNNLITSFIGGLANINTNNNANIQNHLAWDLNTGRNKANGNNGDVSIKTGNIFADLFIDNDPINSGHVDVGCCNNQNPPPPGGENPPPSNPPSSSNPPTTISEILGAGGGSSGPAVLGLSATGGLFDNPIIFWAGLLMLTFGIAILGKSLPSKVPSRHET